MKNTWENGDIISLLYKNDYFFFSARNSVAVAAVVEGWKRGKV